MSEFDPSANMSRRAFLQGGLAVSGGFMLAAAIPKPAAAVIEQITDKETHQENRMADQSVEGEVAQIETPQTPTPTVQVHEDAPSQQKPEDQATKRPLPIWSDFPEWYQEFGSPDQTIIESVAQGYALDALLIPSTIVLSKLGIPIGNAALSEAFNDPEKLARLPRASKLFIQGAIKAPIKEELVFRAAPSALLNLIKRDDSGYQTTSGALVPALLTSTWFGLAHNKGAEKKALPLPQFAAGMLFWRQLRNSGIIHPIATHAATNALLGAVTLPIVEKKRKAAIAAQQEEMIDEIARTLIERLRERGATSGNGTYRGRRPGGSRPQQGSGRARELTDEEARASIRRIFGDGPNEKPLH